jgi:hypothetical protein
MANDHYVPRFYLRNFAPSGKPGRIYAYRRNQRPSLVGIKRVASEEDFDLLKSDKHPLDKDLVAKLFKKSEDEAAPIIQKMLAAVSLSLTSEERAALATFISYLMYRNPTSMTKLMNLRRAFDISHLKVMAQNQDGFEQQCKERGLDYSPEEREKLRQQVLNFEKNFRLVGETPEHHDFYFLMGFVGSNVVRPVLLKKSWVLINNTSTRMLITSDNPAILIAPENHPPQMGIGVENGLVYLPLSPQRGLMLVNDRPAKTFVNIKRDAVTELNIRMLHSSFQSVFSNVLSPELEKAYNKTHENNTVKVVVNAGNLPQFIISE